MQKISYSALCLIAILLSACGGGTTSRSISGSVSGPTSAVVLQNNGGDNLTVSAAGTFSFGTPVADGNTYDITVLTQPAGQTCAVSKGTGIVSGDDITDVAVTCTRKAYSVGGTISGLTGNLVLQNNSADNLALTADGVFNFATHLKDDNPYNVTVLTQPAGQHCGVTNGTGTIAEASVSNIAVTCVTNGDSVSFYKPVGSLQCVGGGMSIPQMEHPLAYAGIQVISSSCGNDGRMYPAVCGHADGNIGIFEVPADQAPAALKLGFALLSDLPDAMKTACPVAKVSVVKSLGSTQCVIGGGILLSDMQQGLIDAGISVISSSCGNNGLGYPAVCGYADGRIGILDIPASHVQAALVLGFTPLSYFPDATKETCPNTKPPAMGLGLLVKPRAKTQLAVELLAFDAHTLAQVADVEMTVVSVIPQLNVYLIELGQPFTESETQIIAQLLMSNIQDVEYAEANRMFYGLEGVEIISSLMVKPRVGSQLVGELDAFDARALVQVANVAMTVLRPMSGGAYVINLDKPVTLTEARAIAERLMLNHQDVEVVEPDRRAEIHITTPAIGVPVVIQ